MFSEILRSEICTKLEKLRERKNFEWMRSQCKKLRENHETIQQLTSQLQQMQEQRNSANDSGDFQDVESNSCGRLSHVSSQPVMIPSFGGRAKKPGSSPRSRKDEDYSHK